jgi:hypothetical protein
MSVPGFFHGEDGKLPPGAVVITNEQHQAYMDHQVAGRSVVFDGPTISIKEPPTPTSEHLATWRLHQGLTVTSKTNPALDGLYMIDPLTREHIAAELKLLDATGAFSDNEQVIVWQDSTGEFHPFSVKEFRAFAVAVNRYAALLHRVRNGSNSAFPPETVEID